MSKPPASTISRSRKPRTGGARSQLRVHVVEPTAVRTSWSIESAGAVLGRDGSGPTALVVDDPTISRTHLAFDFDAREAVFTVRDLESRNGSWVNGRRLAGEPVQLSHGDVIRAADVLVVVERPPVADAEDVSRTAIPGESAAACKLRAAVERAAPDRSPVLLLGETGTGKERVAAEIHRASGRAGALVSINCAALARELVESQLFGHTKGAFTGATQEQTGLFRAADGGTLFLDEIGELALDLQPKLLRAVQEGEVTPVGSTKSVRVDVRVVAATNLEVASAVEAGRFRRDLYARLSLWELAVPALRERRADLFSWIELLARQRATADVPQWEPEAAEALLLAPWPNNLRGLDRLLHELSGREDPIAVDELPPWLRAVAPEPITQPATAPTRDEFLRAFEELAGNVHALARHFDRDRRQIYRWMEQFGLRQK